MVSAAIKANVIPQALEQPFREYSAVRNRVVHGDATDISNATLQLVFSVATDLFRALAVEPRPDVLIVCEGRTDQIILSSFVDYAARIAHKRIVPQFVISGGKAPMGKALAQYLEPYMDIPSALPHKLLVVLDSDGDPHAAVVQREDDLLWVSRQLPGEIEIKIVFADPTIESWVGTALRRTDLHEVVAGIDWNARSQSIPEMQEVLTFLSS